MDLLHGGMLLDADRPDLAEPILRAALNAAPAGTALHLSASQALALTLERLGRTAEARQVAAPPD